MADPYPSLPDQVRLTRSSTARTYAGDPAGEVLLGGSPLRLVRLNPTSAAVVGTLFGGATLEAAARAHHRSVRSVEQLARRLLVTGMADPDWSLCTPMTSDAVTVVIPIKDRPEQLQRLLSALTTVGLEDGQVVVVDDGSEHDLTPIVRHFGARYLRNETPLGPSAARNRGLDAVTTELVAFIDSDVVVHPGWLEPLLAQLVDPAVAVVAPRVASAPGTRVLQRYEAVRSPLDLGPLGGYVVANTRLSYVPAAALIARVAGLRTVGSFDTSMRVGEDVDLVWRLANSGHIIRYEPTSIVHHDPRATLRQLIAQRAEYGASSAALNRRHRGKVKPVSANRWSYAVWLSAAFGGWIGVVVGGVIATVTSALLPAKLHGLRDRRTVGLRLAAAGHLGMGRLLAGAVRRAWLPPLVVASCCSKRSRRVLYASALIPPMIEWTKARPRLDPLRWVALRCLDDAAYCAGVWRGCLKDGNFDALLPDVQNWPSSVNPGQDEPHGFGI